MPEVYHLLGGLRVVIEPLPHTYSASVCCYVGVGSGHELDHQSGMAHFIEHLLFKGTKRRPNPKILIETIEGVGGMIDAYTNVESTVYTIKVAHIHLERAVDVLADMMMNPLLLSSDIEKERRVIIEEISQTEDTPAELVHLLSDYALWGDQPLGRDIAGSAETVARFTRDELVAFWQQAYTCANITISIAGNVDVEGTLALVTKVFEALPAGEPIHLRPTSAPVAGPKVTVKYDESEQVHFCLGMPALSINDPDRRAQLVFDAVVGGNSTSRLFQEIREERALAYVIGSYSREYADAGKWVVGASVDPEHIGETIQAVMHVLRTVLHAGIDASELAQIKEQVKGGILLSLEDTMAVAMRNGSHLLRYGRIIPVEDVVRDVERLELSDIIRVTQRILCDASLHLTLIGPIKETDALAAELHFVSA